MITVLLPIMNAHHITYAAIDRLIETSKGTIDIIVVDNASQEPFPVYTTDDIEERYQYNENYKRISIRTVRNENNIAGYGALLQTLPLAQSDIILWMHNDVLIHEQGWDTRILKTFEDDDKLGIAGFFGAYGVADNGGRIGSMGNMLGKVWGTPQHMHGDVMTGIYPAVVFDSLAIIIRKSHFEYLMNGLADMDFDERKIPPHHWNDRILPLLFVLNGYHAATIGIAFDHKGGVSSLGDAYRELAERWSKEQGLEMVKDWDYTFYSAGERFFRELGAGKFPVIVNGDYSVRYGG